MDKIIDREWSSHQPLIQAVMEFYKPKYVLELGAGDYSTPFFFKPGVEYWGIENDEKWVEYLKSKFPGINMDFHNLGPNVELGTHLHNLSEEKKKEISDYYDQIVVPDIHPRLLFVDQFTCARTLSINSLGNKFDMIIYHDCQEAGIKWYDYNLINLKGYKNYYLKSDVAWTGLLIKNLDLNFKCTIDKFCIEYQKNNPEMKTMSFNG